MISLEGLNLAKSLYGSWDSVIRAGLGAEVMRAFANYQIQLTGADEQALRQVFYIGYDDNVWNAIIKQYRQAK